MRSVKSHYKALLAKWLWRFGVERESLWRKVVVARFALCLDWDSKKVMGRYRCGIWKSIQKEREGF